MMKLKNSDPSTVFLKAYEDTTGEILGMAKWNVYYPNQYPQYDQMGGKYEDYYSDKDAKTYVDTITEIFLQVRNEAILQSKGNLVSLDILSVDPKHQRKKVGDALVKWGTVKADELGVETVVESSIYGKGLYLKNGFVFQKDVTLQLPPQYADQPPMTCAWLIRPKKS